MNLNERQLALYEFFVKRNQSSLEGICFSLDTYYDRASETCSKANSSAFRKLRKDIEIINLSNSQYAILPIKKAGKLQGYKLAERNEEILGKADKMEREAKRLLKRASELRKKVKNDNQFRIASEDEIKVIKSTL